MGYPPESILNYFDQNPDGTLVGYLAGIIAQPAVFTTSLREQDRLKLSIDELNSAIDMTPDCESHSKILQISETAVLKVGWDVKMGEAEALILVAAKTKVPVPRVLSAYTIGEIGFILMSKVEGETLYSYLDSMSPEELQVIFSQLKSYVLEWRKLDSSFIGSVGYGPCQDILFQHPRDYKSRKQYGPFNSFEDYKLGVIDALRSSRPAGVWGEKEQALKERILSFPDDGSTRPGVLTHGDLHPGNIIVKDGLVSGIIDWGAAGYSPPERELFEAKRTLDKFWIEKIHSFIPILPKKYELWEDVDRSMMRYAPL
ncbi:hypothetical protein FQN54_007061 [Arachnomyces sp. PD_36]|nr:hypothetical protein FQN54_007061 [Arachnomyces sp. PD_36]